MRRSLEPRPRTRLFVAMLLGAVACSASQERLDLRDDRELRTLTGLEREVLCQEHYIDLLRPDQPPGEWAVCPQRSFGGVTVHGIGHCVLWLRDNHTDCTHTVEQWKACRAAIAEDVCVIEVPECEPLRDNCS